MKSTTTILSLLLLSSIIAQAEMPVTLVNAERAKILAEVKSVPKLGACGPVAIWGTIAFPILSAPNADGIEMPIAAAAGYAKGRVILFGQNSYLTGNGGGDHAQLLANCVRWASGKQKPRIGLYSVNGKTTLDSSGFRSEAFNKLDKKSLNDYDVVIVNMQGAIDAEGGVAVADYIKGGGGFIGGMTGWAFGQTSGGKDLAVAHGLNQALLPMGIAITDMTAFDRLASFEARVELPGFMNASDAILAIRKQQEGKGAALTAPQLKQASNAIQIALAAQSPGRNNLQQAVLGALGEADSKLKVPTQATPLTDAQDGSARLRLGMEARVLKLASGETVTPHPAHEVFPGKIPAETPRTKGQVTVIPAIAGWASTGLYAAAGDTITVTIPAANAGKGYSVRIGCHSDTLYHLDKWQRVPDICRSTSLETAVTKTASAFGGLIYIEVPSRDRNNTETFTATIDYAVPAPLFVLGKDNDSTWKETQKRPAPWAELAGSKIIVTCPTEVARTIKNPTELMTFWDAVVTAQDDLSNQAAERRRPERIVCDVQISAGYMHSGYPIMVPTSAAAEMITLTRLKWPGWGFYHEIGHNHQRPEFTFDGCGEVTNNVIGMYCYEAVLKKDKTVGHTGATPERQKEYMREIKSADNKFAAWKKDPFLALTTYIQLVDEFGWDTWRDYLHSFADDKLGPKPTNEEEARNQFLTRYSKLTKKNLGPFFDFWGIPVSSAAKAEVSKMEVWMPKGAH